MRAILWVFFVLAVLQSPSAPAAEDKASLFTGIVVKSARGAGGAEVVEVKPGSFGDSAGLKAGDIIVQVDEAEVDSLDDFVGLSKETGRKDDVAVIVLRGGNNVAVEILRDPLQAAGRKSVIGGAVESVEGAASSAVGFAEEKTHEAVKGAKDVAGDAAGYAEEAAHKAVKGTKEAASDAYEYAGEAAHKGVEVTEEAASGAYGYAKEGAGDVKEAAGEAYEYAGEAAHKGVEVTKEAASDAYGYAKEGAEDVKEAAGEAAGFAEKEAHKAVKSAEDTTVETLKADEGMPKETQKPEEKKNE